MDKKEIKKTIRKEIAHLKKNHTMEWQEKMSALILSKLEETDQFRNARSIAIYHAIPGEVQTESFINKWHKAKQLYLPVIENDFLKLPSNIILQRAIYICNDTYYHGLCVLAGIKQT